MSAILSRDCGFIEKIADMLSRDPGLTMRLKNNSFVTLGLNEVSALLMQKEIVCFKHSLPRNVSLPRCEHKYDVKLFY